MEWEEQPGISFEDVEQALCIQAEPERLLSQPRHEPSLLGFFKMKMRCR